MANNKKNMMLLPCLVIIIWFCFCFSFLSMQDDDQIKLILFVLVIFYFDEIKSFCFNLFMLICPKMFGTSFSFIKHEYGSWIGSSRLTVISYFFWTEEISFIIPCWAVIWKLLQAIFFLQFELVFFVFSIVRNKLDNCFTLEDNQ